jgi:beta-fructofuranosidase
MNKVMKTTIYSVFAIMLSASGLMACSDDDFGPDPAKNWAETTTFFAPTDDAGFNTYYMPAIGRVGDPMPFYDKKAGEFKVLYLQEFDNNPPFRFHPIWGLRTTDGANYQSMGEVLPTATNDYAQDAALGTGCAVYNEKEGLYYIYYTGHNGNSSSREVVLRATSPDFKTWTKDVAWSIKGVEYGYSGNDFRDPQIFTTDDGVYHMVISTYPSWGGDPKFAEFKSNDMKTWEHVGMFNMIWDRMLECPDIFKMGNYWYLVFSQSNRASWSRKVKYMVATSWEGLKDCFNSGPKWPADGPLWREGTLDTRAFYAAKTASNGTDRYIWGWSPYRSGKDIHEKNINVGADGEPNWSGALVCHKIIQHEDGTLTLGAVPAIAAKYTKQQPVNVMASNGYNNGTLSGEGAYVLYNRLGTCNHITFTVKTASDADRFGVSFVRDTDAKKYYTMMVNPEENGTARKVNFEQEGPEGKGYIDGADGYGFYRPADNTYKVDIYTDNSVVVMYINDNVCSTQRIYGIQKNCWSINSYGGSITVSDVKVSQQ